MKFEHLSDSDQQNVVRAIQKLCIRIKYFSALLSKEPYIDVAPEFIVKGLKEIADKITIDDVKRLGGLE